MHLRRLVIGTFLALIFLVGPQQALAGFGITPPYFRSDTLTRGSVFTQEIILVRGDPVDDLKAEISINVPEADEWITINPGLEFTLPAGAQQFPIEVTIRVPENARYDTYTGNFRIRTSSLGGSKSGVSIALGAQVDVNLEVVDQIEDFKVRRVEIKELEEGYRKWWIDYPGRISFWVHVENTGNTETAPSRVEFTIFDKTGEVLLEQTQNTNTLAKVAPFDTQRIVTYLPTQLRAGRYQARFKVFKGDEPVKDGMVNMSILPEGLVPGYEKYGWDGLSTKQRLWLVLPPVGAVLLLVIIIVVVIMVLKRRKYGPKRPPRQQRPPSGPSQRPPRQPFRQQQPPVQQPPQQAPVQRPAPMQQRPQGPSTGGVIDLKRR